MAGSSSKTCYFTIQNQSSGYFPRPLRITEVWAFVWVVKVHLWLLIRRPHGRVDVANWMGFLGVKGWPEKVITRWKDDWNDAYHSNFIICHWNFGRVVFSLYGLIRFRAPTWFLLLLCWSTTYGSYSSWYLYNCFLIIHLIFTAKPIKTMFFKSVKCHEKINWLSPDLFNCCLTLTLLVIPYGGAEAPNNIKHHLMRMDGTIQLLG